MATKKTRRATPSKRAPLQYSKKLSAAVTIFWIVYRLAELVAAVIEPSIADALVQLVAGVDTVMMVNLGFYTGNSTVEKMLRAWIEKGKNNNDEENEDEEQP